MTIKVTILSYPNNLNVKKALVAAKFGNSTEVEVVYDPSPFQMGVTNKTPEFLKLNPTGKVPVAITPDGPLFESNAIARYVARKSDKSLLGNNDYEASVIDQWIEFNSNELVSSGFGLVRHVFGRVKHPTKEAFDANVEGLKKVLGCLESALGAHKFLVADRITLADIVIVISLSGLFTHALGKDAVAHVPKVISYVQAVLALPQFQGIETYSIKESTATF